jgi:membrane associated rhomboid family serine protease
MIFIPIRTETPIRRTPHVNYALIGINVFVFFLFHFVLPRLGVGEALRADLRFHSGRPALYQFLTYQFMHADTWHLLGNLLFLWVFGNSVNGKMGQWVYLLFYLAGGIVAAWGFALAETGNTPMVGASGAIAAVTTAYLVLFPRSRVKVLLVFFLIRFFDMPAMVLIGFKIILWDNVIAPSIAGGDQVAYSAHLAGYAFGFAAATFMLLTRALPRDQFDMLALWKRWHKRREIASLTASPEAAARARFGAVARVSRLTPEQEAQAEAALDQITRMRGEISERLYAGDDAGAARLYEKLLAADERQCLPEQQQHRLARAFYAAGKFPQAAAAFERFVTHYPRSPEHADIRLLLGIIYARDLRRYEEADKLLTESMERLVGADRRAQCLSWLGNVRASLGRPAPEGWQGGA